MRVVTQRCEATGEDRSTSVVVAFASFLLLTFLLWPQSHSDAQDASPQAVAQGRDLFVASCASCHGAEGEGTANGPSLEGAGTATVDFQLRTGRMPLADPALQPRRKPPVFDTAEIAALVDYVTSLGPGGPAIPLVDPGSGDLSVGQQLFVANCAPCHGATGTGGAVGKGSLAPSLSLASDLEIAEAMIVGPGEMPVFDFAIDERNAVVAYVRDLEEQPDRGGVDSGGVGPVPEGFVGWGIGMGACFAIVWLVGHRRPRRPGERT